MEDLDWVTMAAALERGAEVHRDATRATAGWLRDLLGESAPVGRVLDAGSGPGVVSCLLAHAFPGAEVVAADGTPQLLDRVRARAAEEGLEGRVRTLHAELPEELDSLGTADVVWTSQVIHHLGDQQAALDALAGRLRPGGVLAVTEGGLPPRFLPRDIGLGRPGLQARLEVLLEDWFTGMRAGLPGSTAVTEDWPAMLATAGLVPAGTRTFLTDLPAPLQTTAREHLLDRLTRVLERGGEEEGEGLTAEDRRTLERLVDPDAPESVLWRPDAFFLDAVTVHVGRAPTPRDR